MPNNWKTYKLGDIAKIGSSKRIFKADYVDTGIPFYRSKEIIQKSFGQEIDEILYIDEAKYIKIKEKFGAPISGDILLSAVGNRSGIPYLVNNDGEFYFKDGNLMWFRDFQNYVDSSFLVYWFKSSVGQHYLNSTMIGSAQKALTIESVKNIEISVPKIFEQKAIANILSAIDDKIENNLAINKTLEDMAMALYKHWFIDFRPFQEGEFIDSELGPIPKDWEVKKVKDIYSITIGRTPPRKQPQWFSKVDGVKWMSIKDLRNSGSFIFNTSEFLTEEAVKKFRVPIIIPNTVILSFKLTVGRVAIATENMLSNEAIAHFNKKGNNCLSTEYLYLYLKNFDFNSLGSTSSIATAVNSQTIKNMYCLVPNEMSKKVFESQVKQYFDQIKNKQIENQYLTRLRDTLLSKLISGEVRLKEFQEQIETVL